MVANVEQQLFLRSEMEDFLFAEAELLDDGEFHKWLEMCSEDIRYIIPVRLSRERANGDGTSTAMTHWDDDFLGLQLRVLRLDTEYAWAEDPPSRVRRHVSNVRVSPKAGTDEYDVRSNLLLFRNRGDSPQHDLISAERQDVIRRGQMGLRLARRRVVLDHAVLGTHNLAHFF
ncbi:aromatic-ring-hydroxylating dioxygenase subunit beta [[Mycobacterium] burgundiense]|uniref:Aromatic-ring-hydroxylating dioxygenase subunit beta n=1 Tax=[Mycobacterium] burgundiense TaxID=3064286 RepID=A0ABN9NVJ8_9MYCO|nr:aromatic-ring-hydroxylating dioxygenase subunit beta [Mycolicibacterium sp. MU0053]CAJ1511186.1 aromatic-ring-hydroxylating dioxygenase subunit beta [Mycolicibacterium sp. MU0053]